MGHCINMCEAIIVKQANYWSKRLPAISIYSKDDLISEGWLIYMDCLGRNNKAKFTTYLQKSVQTRFIRILTNELKRVGPPNTKKDPDKCYCFDTFPETLGKRRTKEGRVLLDMPCSPERLVMVSQAIAAIAEVSTDFASMLTDGASQEFLAFVTRHMRAKKFKRGLSTRNGNILFTKELIENFFGVRLKDLRILVSNYL